VPNYTLPDGETVKNRLGASSHSELEAIEVDFVRARQMARTWRATNTNTNVPARSLARPLRDGNQIKAT
jgi:hypothetical protein